MRPESPAWSADERTLLGWLDTLGPVEGRALAEAARLPRGLVFALLDRLRDRGDVKRNRSGTWSVTAAAKRQADAQAAERAGAPSPLPAPAEAPSGPRSPPAGYSDDGDDRVRCVDCSNLVNGRCLAWRAAELGGPEVGTDLAGLAQRCHAFAPSSQGTPASSPPPP